MPEGFDVTAQRRGHLLRAAVVGALVSGAVLLPAAPALADVNANPGSITLNPGEEKQITITVDKLDLVGGAQARISAQGLGNEVSLRGPGGCQGNGGQTLTCQNNAFEGDNDEKKLSVSVTAKNPSGLQPNQTRDGSINIEGRNGDDSVNITLKGPAQAQGATEVSGKVTDQSTGDGVPAAQVSLKDSAGTTHDVTANNSGNFSIKPSGNKTIAPGAFTITATKEGFADATSNGTAQAGKATNNVGVRMKPTAASASPPPPASDPPTAEASPDTSNPAAATQNTSGEEEGTSKLSWILIGMGVLLVLLGIGAIVLLVMRRKDDGEGDPDGYGNDPGQMAPAGAYAGGGATMVGGRSNMNDATAIVGPNQQLDEFPDPYAAPAPAPTRVGGYNDSTSVAPGGYDEGYGNNGGGYRDERGYAESPRGGYDEPRGGYGGGQGGQGGYADQATGVYQGNDQGGYPAAGGGYGGQQGGYGANGNANGGGANGYGGYDGDFGHGGGQGGQGGGQGYPAAGGGYDRDYAERNGRNRSEWQD